MGKPAARIGDMTMHGGSLTVGSPTVLIGGMPAARIGDMHVCPMMTPGTPPIPHVGGPVSMGSAGVLIGGMPAARMGDLLVCVGPPDTIAMGCPTVLIGEVGSGAGGGGGGGGGGAAAAQSSAATALVDNKETATKNEHWVEFEFVDSAGLPVSGVPYRFTDPDGNESEGVLRLDGTIRRDGISEGECKVVLMSVSDAKWGKEEAEVGEAVKMSAKVEGIEDGTDALFQVFKRDITGPDVVVAEVEADVRGEKVEGEWEFPGSDETDEDEDEEDDFAPPLEGYSSPVYYYDIVVGGLTARSGVLKYKDWIEIELLDESGQPVANQDYSVYLPDGSVRSGKLDGSGRAKLENVPPGEYSVRFEDPDHLSRQQSNGTAEE